MRQVTDNVFVETERRGSNHGLVTTADGLVLIDGPRKPSDEEEGGVFTSDNIFARYTPGSRRRTPISGWRRWTSPSPYPLPLGD